MSFEVAAEAVLREIKVPRTEFYKEKSHVNRIFVSKENPANRLAHTQEQLDTKGLPATDLAERYGTCAVVGNSGGRWRRRSSGAGRSSSSPTGAPRSPHAQRVRPGHRQARRGDPLQRRPHGGL